MSRENKDKRFEIRLSESERERFFTAAEACGMTPSQYIKALRLSPQVIVVSLCCNIGNAFRTVMSSITSIIVIPIIPSISVRVFGIEYKSCFFKCFL